MALKVLKFGGTSVGSAEALRRVAAIVATELPHGGLVVVSALSGTTDRILEALRLASGGDLPEAKSAINTLRNHHEGVAQDLALRPNIQEVWA
ncbi:MAG: bifunctional aspartate kinase/homoserine dehydrogenase I, partial [Acidobacteriota bacterium]|nr:bifunctional aspartate kinase/homoserine dehydrogenase I [Acidobacteriota bacterium]